MRASAFAQVRAGALRHNLGKIQRHAPDYRVMAVIKANGYGHGLVTVARALSAADAFAVARVEEALRLRSAGIDKPIVLLEGIFGSEDLELSAKHQFELVVHCEEQIRLLSDAYPSTPVNVWLKIDTGMHRLGIAPEDFASAASALRQAPAVEDLKLMTHFAQAEATADRMTEDQMQRLVDAAGQFDGAVTLANSAAILAWKAGLDAVSTAFPQTGPAWIRPGISLYGVSPFPDKTGPDLGLEPAMDLVSMLIAIKSVRAGARIGYGGRFVARTDMRIGVAAAGYADGYPWCMPDGTAVIVRGRRAPLAGRVSMDMITVDLSQIPDARVGDTVLLWGRGLPVEEIAMAAGTSPYELVCRVSERVIRMTE